MNRAMTFTFLKPSRILASALCVSIGAIAEASFLSSASAQSLSVCPTAANGEYLLLINNPSPEEQNRLSQVLPTGATTIQCDYQGIPVVQVGNFADEDLAQSWAEYLSTVEGFQTAIAPRTDSPDANSPEPPAATPVVDSANPDETPTPEPTPNPSNPSDTPTYKPTVLEPGYAVLVRYFDRPELAAQLQSQLNASVGLAVYEQQPYLLALYSSDAVTAGQVLQQLSQQFSVLMVDSSQVVVLSPAVSVAESVERSANLQ